MMLWPCVRSVELKLTTSTPPAKAFQLASFLDIVLVQKIIILVANAMQFKFVYKPI